ncbi:hypothetical protein GCM10025874_08420 [Arenivirga flava]|uniref:DNA/pantothenate metabolism flavoprotein C-terminal domain-containing protein n=1 Tax=Arenivirga flava TaxID=1930060 RepID=A0AA37UEF4_9MICO|nr:hypothetical protein GCM10025874_08420 [Arenivirga flava]
MAAAVADYRPAETAEGKLKKDGSGADLQLRLIENPDVLASLGARRPEGMVLVGFAAETEADDERLLELGRAKIARKGADLLVLNRVGWTEGFASPRNTVTILDRTGDRVGQAAGDKLAVAHRILDAIRPLTSI